MSIFYTIAEPAIDQPSVVVGDGVIRARNHVLVAGQVPAAPFWLQLDDDLAKVLHVTSLPFPITTPHGAVRFHTFDPRQSEICEAVGGASCWYVAVGGSGDGSFGDPFGLPQQGVDATAPGDFVYPRGGTYTNGIQFNADDSGLSGQLVVVKAYPGETVILSGVGVGFDPNFKFARVEGLIVDGDDIGTGTGVFGVDTLELVDVEVRNKQMPSGNNGLIGFAGNIDPFPANLLIEGAYLHDSFGDLGETWDQDPDVEHHAGFMFQGGTMAQTGGGIVFRGSALRRAVIERTPSCVYLKFDNSGGNTLFGGDPGQEVVMRFAQRGGWIRSAGVTFRRVIIYELQTGGFRFQPGVEPNIQDETFEDCTADLKAGRLFTVDAGASMQGFIVRRNAIYVQATADGVASGDETGLADWDRNTYMVPVGAAATLDILEGRNLAAQRAQGWDLNSIVLEGLRTDFFQDPDNGDYTPIGELAKHHAQPVLTKPGNQFLLDGAGVSWFGLRAANALQDDTIAQRLIDAFSTIKAHGMQSFSICMQGGNAGGGNSLFNSFNADGTLITAFSDRLLNLLDEARAADMVPCIQFFYQGRDEDFTNDDAIRNAIDEMMALLAPYRGLWIQALNEPGHAGFTQTILNTPAGLQEVYSRIKGLDPGRLTYVHSIASAHDAPLTCVDTWGRGCNAAPPAAGEVTIEYVRHDEYNDPGDFTQAERDATVAAIQAAFAVPSTWFHHSAWTQLADGTPGFPRYDKGGVGSDADPGVAFAWDEMLAQGGPVT